MTKNKIKGLLNKYTSLSVQVKASFWFLICGFLQKGVSIITTPIFTRLLSTAEYGQYSVFNSWLGIVSVFVTLQLYSGAFTQGMVKFENKKTKYASSIQGLCLTLVVCWTIIYLLFHEFWNNLFELTIVQMLAMLVLIWSTSVFNFWSVEQRVDLRYHTLVTITIVATLAKPLVGIVFVILAEDKVTARILGLALVELVCYTWMFFSQMHRGKTYFDRSFWKHALLFNLPLLPHYLSMVVLNSSDRIMINNMVGSNEAGIYSLAYSISQITTVLNTALLQTIEPWMYKKIKAKRMEDLSGVAYPAVIGVSAVNILLIAFAPEAIALFAPPAYYDAIWVIPPVAMSVYFMFAYSFFAVFEFYYEKTKYIAIATVSGAVLNIVLNYIFIKLFGYCAAGYTTLACFIIFAVYHFHFMRKICKKEMGEVSPYSTRILLIITGIFMVLGFALLFTYYNVFVRYVFIVLLFIVVIIKRKTILKMAKKILDIRHSAE
ncbi:oligosaccharide flippase family protein [Enterocloster sp. OA13]|uniref:lipopolysaccharide biosynthesis protein n=1 Tax=Enterocloster sp. OA13 TaxID=2914161 RepID=UPI001F05782D|nr:oligosaccharide flippase family protein [Enterocloster sp. OA13]